MKKIAILTFTFILIAIFGVYLIPVRPVITVKNATKELVYLRATESTYGIEPTPEGVDRIMRVHPSVIEPGKTLKITSSFSSIIMSGYELNIGWLTGGTFEYSATGGGGQNFLLSSKSNICSAILTIHPGYNHFEMSGQTNGICLKKLSVINDKY